MMWIIYLVIFMIAYVANLFVCSIFNLANNTRNPKGVVDYFKLTCFPYILIKWADIKDTE